MVSIRPEARQTVEQLLDRFTLPLRVSGYTADEEILEMVRSGNVDFLEKPSRLADLAESVNRLEV